MGWEVAHGRRDYPAVPLPRPLPPKAQPFVATVTKGEKMKKTKILMLAQLAVLVAMEVVLSRFLSINTPFLKIGFAFVPTAIAGMYFGALPAGAMAVAADLIGATLFPNGAFFPGFTLSAFLGGLTYGLLLHRSHCLWRIAAAACVKEILIGLLLNTYWLTILNGADFFASLVASGRIVQCLAMIPVQLAVLTVITKGAERIASARA